MIRQFELVEKVKAYDPTADEDIINRAYVYSMKMHGTQKRASGDPYFVHPLEVANILTDMKLDTATIATALLHDTVEDTLATLEDIEKHFGGEIKGLVDGVTKLSRIETKSENAKQAENFRKLLVALSEDIRVLLVKLADRLHNMQTLEHIKNPDKRARIAHETLEIYAPLAERIGMRRLKDELQDLSFKELFPEAREGIINRLNFLREQGKAAVDKTVRQIETVLHENGLPNAKVQGREKKPYSIWKKMETKNMSFEQLSDIVAFRIMVDSVAECYQALGIVHSQYHTIPGQFKDYISTPKINGYRSIHTSVIGPAQQRIEVQIRTENMHDEAEYGLAAHWTYKQQRGLGTDGKQFRWVRELLDILERSAGPEEFLENTKLEMYHDQVFCFTPKGDVIALPRGATPVDFAYAVHSGVGDTCVGAKVNSRIVPLRVQLKNGDQVEIITSKAQTPSPAWERFVVTGKARAEIRKFVRTQQRTEYINLGKAILTKTFKNENEEFDEKLLQPILHIFNKKLVEDLIAEVGEGIINRSQVFEAVFPDKRKKTEETSKKSNGSILDKFTKKKAKSNPIPIKGLIPGMAIHFAGCCHPIPGDKIVGIVTTGKGITIHTTDCETLENFSDTPERWMEVAWDVAGGGEVKHVGRVKASVSHETGGLATVTNSIAKDLGNINNIKILNRSSDFFEIILDIEVKDLKHLNNIIANLKAKDVVQSIERFHG